jgi:hypothetical protein
MAQTNGNNECILFQSWSHWPLILSSNDLN